MEQAYAIGTPEVMEQIERIKLNYNSKRMVKDGFKPGWDGNFGQYVHTYQQHKELCKANGLVELGNDYQGMIKDTTTTGGYCNTLEFALEAKKIGIDLTDSEVEAIASGEYFDSSKVDLSGGKETTPEE